MGNNKVVFFKRNKIKKRHFKKKTFLIKRTVLFIYNNILLCRSLFFLNKNIGVSTITKIKSSNNLIITLSQKLFNTKCTIFNKKNLNTFSVGSIIKYFKVKQSKYIRRSIKGVKIFLNFIKSVLEKRYLKTHKGRVVLNIVGVDYNIVNLIKSVKILLKNNLGLDFLFLINLKISFTKKKNKKIKSIKKRLKKKLILIPKK